MSRETPGLRAHPHPVVSRGRHRLPVRGIRLRFRRDDRGRL